MSSNGKGSPLNISAVPRYIPVAIFLTVNPIVFACIEV